MVETIVLLALVTAQRLGELVYARSNEARLRAAGAVEIGAAHFPVIVALHATWLVALWALGWRHPLHWGWTALYLVLQFGRIWVLATLGRRWTTRVFVQPGETLVKRGPYRFVSHPNYVIVEAEMIVLPLCLGLPWIALAFGAANLVMLAWRVHVEGRALASIAGGA